VLFSLVLQDLQYTLKNDPYQP